MLRKIVIISFLLCAVHAVFAQTALTKYECKIAVDSLETTWRAEKYNEHKIAIENECIEYDNLKLMFKSIAYGQKPVDGRSLYISLHGGGSVPTAVNDQQWRNQIRLYSPSEGVYVAPRAPWDAWNMWFQPGLDELLEKVDALVQSCNCDVFVVAMHQSHLLTSEHDGCATNCMLGNWLKMSAIGAGIHQKWTNYRIGVNLVGNTLEQFVAIALDIHNGAGLSKLDDLHLQMELLRQFVEFCKALFAGITLQKADVCRYPSFVGNGIACFAATCCGKSNGCAKQH